MPWLDKNGHVVKPKSEQSQPRAESSPDKETLGEQPSMVAIEDNFSEIAKVMQDCESETQEPMKTEEEKDSMPKLKRGQKYSVKDLLKAQDADSLLQAVKMLLEDREAKLAEFPNCVARRAKRYWRG